MASRSRTRSAIGSLRGSEMRDRRATMAIAKAVMRSGMAHHTSADTDKSSRLLFVRLAVTYVDRSDPSVPTNAYLRTGCHAVALRVRQHHMTGETGQSCPPPSRQNVKPLGRVVDARLPLACIHPLSQGLRRADARDPGRPTSNLSNGLPARGVDISGESLGATRGQAVERK